MAQFSLSWDLYKQNICSGLSALQQNGEFVDMTLAADGHHVKVHQMVMSLVSPYIKDVLSSIQSPHPVIFLNRISHATLCAMLEYIYTGEVLIAKDNLPDLIEAGKELRIKGLEDMKVELSNPNQVSQAMLATVNEGQPLSQTGHYNKEELLKELQYASIPQYKITRPSDKQSEPSLAIINDSEEQINDSTDHHHYDDDIMDATEEVTVTEEQISKPDVINSRSLDKQKGQDTQVQYTISNQGAIQLILNRFIYYLRYTSRKSDASRQWRCVDNTKKTHNCPATVLTKDGVVVKRFGAHNHPFHDKKILKKVRDNAVYTALHDAEQMGLMKKEAHKVLPVRRKKGTY